MPDIQQHKTFVVARGKSLPVWVFGEPGAPPGPTDLLFLHGYARDPRDYTDFLKEVATLGHRIVAPFLFANGGLKSPPIDFWACAALAQRTLEALRSAKLIDPTAPVFGHSTGGAAALALGRVEPRPRALVAFNPVQPATGPPCGFMARSAWMNVKMALGLAGSGRRARKVLLKTGGRFYVNWLRSPIDNFRLIGGLRAYDYESLSKWHGGPCPVPATVAYGHGDEFYPSGTGLESGLKKAFVRSEVVQLPEENSHEWLLFRPERAAGILARALG